MECRAPIRLFATFGLIASSALALLVATPGAVRADARAEPIRLILSGTDLMLPANLVVDGIIRRVLASSTTGLLEVYSEGLDAYRLKSSECEPELVSSSPVTCLVADVHLCLTKPFEGRASRLEEDWKLFERETRRNLT